jgi:hypothetical protein
VSASTYPSALGAKAEVAVVAVLVPVLVAGLVAVLVAVLVAGLVAVVVPVVVPVPADVPDVVAAGADVSSTSVGGFAVTSRLAKVLPVVEVVVMTNVYVPLPVTTDDTSALAVVLEVSGLTVATRAPTAGALFQVMSRSVQEFPAVETWMPVVLTA